MKRVRSSSLGDYIGLVLTILGITANQTLLKCFNMHASTDTALSLICVLRSPLIVLWTICCLGWIRSIMLVGYVVTDVLFWLQLLIVTH